MSGFNSRWALIGRWRMVESRWTFSIDHPPSTIDLHSLWESLALLIKGKGRVLREHEIVGSNPTTLTLESSVQCLECESTRVRELICIGECPGLSTLDTGL